MRDLSPYFERQFDWKTYTCFHFTRDVWLDVTGVDLGQYVQADQSIRGWSRRFYTEFHNVVGTVIQEIKRPVDPCLVLMRNKTALPHCGVMLDGLVLHLPKGETVAYQPLEEIVEANKILSINYFR